jgi:hypothetical protein
MGYRRAACHHDASYPYRDSATYDQSCCVQWNYVVRDVLEDLDTSFEQKAGSGRADLLAGPDPYSVNKHRRNGIDTGFCSHEPRITGGNDSLKEGHTGGRQRRVGRGGIRAKPGIMLRRIAPSDGEHYQYSQERGGTRLTEDFQPDTLPARALP